VPFFSVHIIHHNDIILDKNQNNEVKRLPLQSGMFGIHCPPAVQRAVMLYLRFLNIWPCGHETLTTVPGVVSVVLTTRENATGRHSMAAPTNNT